MNQVSCFEREAPSMFFLFDDHRRSGSVESGSGSRMGDRVEESRVGCGRCAETVPVV